MEDVSEFNVGLAEAYKLFRIFESIRVARETNDYRTVHKKLQSAFMELDGYLDKDSDVSERLSKAYAGVRIGQPDTKAFWEIEKSLRNAWTKSGMRHSFKDDPRKAHAGVDF